MWVDKRRSWIATVALGGGALPRIWTRTLVVTALSVIVTVVWIKVPDLRFSVTTTPFVLIGLPLGIFLGFRNNAAYDRFWEGRKLWGALVNTSRSLTRQVLTLMSARGSEQEPEVHALQVKLVHTLVAYVHALRHHLRESSPYETLARLLPADQVAALKPEENVPLGLLHQMAEHLNTARRKAYVDVFHVPVLDQSLTALTDIQGACERIKSTPIPFSYTVLLHRIVGVYCGLLPFGLADTIRWGTPLVVLAVSYAFFGLDGIGDEIEQPFGVDTNDLPLKAISLTIEINLRRRLGEEPPPGAKPKKGILI